MASGKKQFQRLARQLFKLSLVDDAVSPERVGGVLAYVERHHPAHARALLQSYHRLIAAELARGRADVEHAGAVPQLTLDAIAAAMTKRYQRPVTAAARRNDALLAGLRIRIGDDVYESSVAAQLSALGASV
ncbi:MAG TPA: F0F1 ATP synthase subunit delta [Opitutus sp.]|nr:F0F1 ATP synthase subunit delta [Opitutus sp.]